MTGCSRHDRGRAVIDADLGRRLAAAGVRWVPAEGDRFVIPDKGMDDTVFTVASMVVDVIGDAPRQLVRFNGTVEWALDSIARDEVIWLPAEHQLRALLGGAFRRLSVGPDGATVDLEVAGRPHTIGAESPEVAYALAVLYLATGH
jgi:hypothetical protein